ncbi:hypothetical protein DAPPUDRAFT_255875 [Daphnia pulex]|uniref:Uncharacterized protein n=1 Tax=Daphnia pulex TaxID=6669 RepID=E9HAA0_DAPPU|nr:hypothetical protein DAPPUDRAFT_255875 [Daphnia pulex]|eukprot:EFX71270.1 hypothetical protein DAPPUDRAFT_255875 [Daphnia pulex]
MSNPIPLAVCWLLLLLLLTCWSSASIVTTRVVGVGDGRLQQHDTLRRIDPAAISEPGDWKPIDYGHPMRDDPTLVYVPPVVDPVHYGIHSAEPLWPIRGSKLPQFHLPPEAMLAASSTEQRWRTRQASRLHKTDVTTTTPRTLFKPSQRTDRPDHHQRLPQFHRHPVRSTAWKRYDHPSNQLIGRSPALGPPLPVILPTFRPGVASIRPTSRPVVLPMSRPRIIPPNTSISSSSSSRPGQHPPNNQQQRLLAGRQRADLPPPANRYFSSNARSYESVIDDGANNGLVHYGISHDSLSSAGKADGMDRADDDVDGLLLNDTSSESPLPPPGNEKKKDVTVSDQHHQQRKRAKKPFFPFQFVIQSGYSKVRKYGNEIRETRAFPPGLRSSFSEINFDLCSIMFERNQGHEPTLEGREYSKE